jgi:hypothetical protein
MSQLLPETIVTPGGSTIRHEADGGYRVCDPQRHCLRVASLWEAQELAHWAEVHHRPLDSSDSPCVSSGSS